MGNYVYLKKSNKKGELGISKNVFKQICEESLKQINGIISIDSKKKTLVSSDDVNVAIKDNEAIFYVNVKINKDSNEEEIKTKINEVLSNNLLYLLDAVPFKIIIKTSVI